MVQIKTPTGYVYMHYFMKFFKIAAPISKPALILCLRILYGELIGVNVYDWLQENNITLLEIEQVRKMKMLPAYEALLTEYLENIEARLVNRIDH